VDTVRSMVQIYKIISNFNLNRQRPDDWRISQLNHIQILCIVEESDGLELPLMRYEGVQLVPRHGRVQMALVKDFQ